MSTTTHRREFDCPVEGRVVLDEACCPVCTKPFEPCDGATHTRHGYGWPPDDCRVLSFCGQCPTDERDRMRAFEVTWTDDTEISGCDVLRRETWRHLGWFDAEGELHLGDDPERDAFRAAFPDLSSTEGETMSHHTHPALEALRDIAKRMQRSAGGGSTTKSRESIRLRAKQVIPALEALLAERDRLRAALDEIVNLDHYLTPPDVTAIAEAALAKGES